MGTQLLWKAKRQPESLVQDPPGDDFSRRLKNTGLIMELDLRSMESWLRVRDDAALAALWCEADEVRHSHVGDEVHLRGLI